MTSENEGLKTKNQARNWAKITSHLLYLSSRIKVSKRNGEVKTKAAQASGSPSGPR
jgi:hypothetical protein